MDSREGVKGKTPAPFQRQTHHTSWAGNVSGEPTKNETTVNWIRISDEKGHSTSVPHKWDRELDMWIEAKYISPQEGYKILPEARAKAKAEKEEREASLKNSTKTLPNPVLATKNGNAASQSGTQQGSGQKHTQKQSTETSATALTISEGSSSSNVVSLHDRDEIALRGQSEERFPGRVKIKGFAGQLLQPREAVAIFDFGCHWCGDSVDHSGGTPKKQIAWLDEDKVVCHNCLRDTHEKPADYTGLFDNKLEKVQKGHATLKSGGEIVLKSAGLTQQDIEDAIELRAVQEATRGRKK